MVAEIVLVVAVVIVEVVQEEHGCLLPHQQHAAFDFSKFSSKGRIAKDTLHADSHLSRSGGPFSYVD